MGLRSANSVIVGILDLNLILGLEPKLSASANCGKTRLGLKTSSNSGSERCIFCVIMSIHDPNQSSKVLSLVCISQSQHACVIVIGRDPCWLPADASSSVSFGPRLLHMLQQGLPAFLHTMTYPSFQMRRTIYTYTRSSRKWMFLQT